MEQHELYKSAMDKVTPSDGWEQDTLQKMAALRAEMNSEKSSQKKKKNALSFRRALVPMAAAAVLTLVVIPTAQNLPKISTQLFSGNAAAAYQFPETAQESPEEGTNAGDRPDTALAKDSVKVSRQSMDQTMHNGLPVLNWVQENQGMGGGSYTDFYKDISDFKTQNPTQDLPTDQLPKELPVWYAPAGPENSIVLAERLQKTADQMGLTLLYEPDFLPSYEPEKVPDGYPHPELWPHYISGMLMDPQLYNPELATFEQKEGTRLWRTNTSGVNLTLNRFDPWNPLEGQFDDPKLAEQANRLAVQQFGSLIGLKNAASQPDTSQITIESFVYEAGSPQDSIKQKLLNYSFKRVSASLTEDGQLGRVSLTDLPASPQAGTYPVRSLEDAKQALAEELAQADSEIPLSVDDLLTWQIIYYSSPFNPYILPVYQFTLRVPQNPAELPQYCDLKNAEDYSLCTTYYISAIPDEYCVEWDYTFN